MSKGGFKSLIVWQKAQDLAVAVYNETSQAVFSREYGLVDQMRRAAVSVSSNIAEGDERSSDRDSVRFFFIAKASIAELRSQLDLAARVGLLPNDRFALMDTAYDEVAKMLRGLIKARSPNE